MPLVEAFPDEVTATLKEHGLDGNGELKLALATDIGPDDKFGEQWLFATDDRVLVLTRNNGRVDVSHDLAMASISAATAEAAVGSGMLSVTSGGSVVELFRYTNTKGKAFHRAAKLIEHIAKKTETPFVDEEEEERFCPNCSRPYPPDTKVCPKCINRRKTLMRLARYAKPHKRILALGITLYLLSHLLWLAQPQVYKFLINDVITPGDATWYLPLVGALLALTVIGWIGDMVMAQFMPRLAAILTRDIRQELYEAFQRLGVGFFDRKQVGALQTRVTQDTQALTGLLSEALPDMLWVLGNFLFISTLLFVMDWQMALIALIPGPIILLVAGWFFRRIMPIFRQYWARWSRLGAVVTDSLSGIRVVKAFAQEDREIGRFAERNDGLFEPEVKRDQHFWRMWPTMHVLTTIGTIIVWGLGVGKILEGRMTLGDLVAINMYLGAFYEPFRWVGRLNQWITRSLTACERIFEILDTRPEVYESPDQIAMPSIQGRVTFSGVTFGYDVHKPVLKNINLDVKPGEMIGLVGPSGAGKSTTISLISHFYEAQEGTVSIDDVDIKKIALHDLRRQIGIVLQEPFLFSGTVFENIAYAKPGASIEEVMAAAKAAHAHEFIVGFPDGYDTQVGERGSRLSGGERQRISIARALLPTPRSLILAEATASVDTETEKKIQDALARLVQGRTSFAIAHRLSTLRNANRLLVLENGEQKELGTHDELLEHNGLYARLVKMQSEINQIQAAVGG